MDNQKSKFFFEHYWLSSGDLERYLGAALSAGGDYADLYFEYLTSTSVMVDESLVKSASQGISAGCGVRVISGERTGYAYSDDLAPEKILHAARTAALIASGPSKQPVVSLKENSSRNLYPVSAPPVGSDVADKVKLVMRADKAARDYDPPVVQVRASYAQDRSLIGGAVVKVGSTISIGGKTFHVAGLSSAPLGGTGSDVYVELSVLQKLANLPGRVNTVQVRATNSGKITTVKQEITKSLSGAQVTTAADLAKRIGGSLTDAKNLSNSLGLGLEIVGLLAELERPDRIGGAHVDRAVLRDARRPGIPRDRVAHLVWHLGAAGGVEEREPPLQRGEPAPHGIDSAGLAQHFGHRQLLALRMRTAGRAPPALTESQR